MKNIYDAFNDNLEIWGKIDFCYIFYLNLKHDYEIYKNNAK